MRQLFSSTPYHRGPVTDHFDGERFFNPGQPPVRNGLWPLLRWQLHRKPGAWAENAFAPVKPPTRSERLRVTMIGHASLLLQWRGVNLLVDPVWSERASPFAGLGPRRFNPPGVTFEDLPPIDAVLITHNHYDHLDLATLRRLWRAHRPLIVAPLGNDSVIRRSDPEIAVRTGDWHESFDLADGIGLTFHPAHHWSARGLRDRRRALWCGYVLRADGETVYLSGDTGYGNGAIFRQVRERHGAPRLAVLPIGAYEPRWFMKAQHVDPTEAVRIMRDCGAGQALGVHWGTFRLSDEGRDQPAEALRAILTGTDLEARFLPMTPAQVWEAGR